MKQQNKEISSNEGLKRRRGSFDNLRQILCRPRHCGKFALPRVIERQQSLADRFVNSAGFRVVVEEINLYDIAFLVSRLDLDQNLADERRDGVD